MPVEIAITFQTDSSYGGSPLWRPLAQIKVDGACEADVRACALEAIERQAGDAAGARFGWPQRPRRVEKLQRLRAVLASYADLAGKS